MKKKNQTEFAALILKALKTSKVKKKEVVAELGIHETSFSRTISGEIKKPMALALIHTINKLAQSEVVNQSRALSLIGYADGEQSVRTRYIGEGFQLVVEGEKFSEKDLSEIISDLRFALEITLCRIKENKDSGTRKQNVL